MKTPIAYYGGKQRLASKIVSLIPEHHLYAEPFFGGGAVFFHKEKSTKEIINDMNKELMNFYRVLQQDFPALKKEIQSSLHSRLLHRQALVIYRNPDLFSPLKRAWAIWVLANQSFTKMLGVSWGYDVKTNTMSTSLVAKRKNFSGAYVQRLQGVRIKCVDALEVIKDNDAKDSFFYCDPPYYNSHCRPYKGYTKQDFENLLHLLSSIKGKFLLSSYPSSLLTNYTKKHQWHTIQIKQKVTAARKKENLKRKIEVLTANYPISLEEQK